MAFVYSIFHIPVREKKELGGYKGWQDKYDYGKRWLSESVLSAVKRIFGETVRAG